MSWNSFWNNVGNGMKKVWNDLTDTSYAHSENNPFYTGNTLNNLWNDLTGQTAEDRRTSETNQANLQAVQDTNATNKAIADENIAYQRELQEYNAALQERMFEREDTSYQRTADDMLKAGLNPLTMQGTNGAGEAIAQSPLNNSFQAIAPNFIKANTMTSPLQALNTFTSSLGSVISSIESIKTGKSSRDALRSQTDISKLNFFLDNIDKGLIYDVDSGKLDLDQSTFDKYLEQKAKEKDYNIAQMKNDMREWEHMEKAGKYYSDTKYEQIITAVEDWLVNGRGKAAWDKLVEKYPLLKIFTPQAAEYAISYQDLTEEEKEEWSKEVNNSVKKAEETNDVVKRSSQSKSQYR